MKLLGFYIKSKNIVEVVNFYQKILSADAIGEGEHFTIKLPDDNGSFIIWNDGNVTDTVNERIVLWFSTDDVDAEYEKLLEMGVIIIEPPTNNPYGARHMVFSDPDGNQIRFITPAV